MRSIEIHGEPSGGVRLSSGRAFKPRVRGSNPRAGTTSCIQYRSSARAAIPCRIATIGGNSRTAESKHHPTSWPAGGSAVVGPMLRLPALHFRSQRVCSQLVAAAED
jgi:hypothetical protein